MNVVVCGSRSHSLTAAEREVLRIHLRNLGATWVLTGGARGVDASARAVALEMGLGAREILADWDAHGRAAGPIRNKQLAAEADHVIAFPGGRGTADMVRAAKRAGVPVTEWPAAKEVRT